MVLDDCAAVRGILNNDQGGPLQPPGLLMAAALNEVRESIQRNLDAKKGGSQKALCRLADCIDWGLEHVQAEQETIREYVEDIDKVAATLEFGGESCEWEFRCQSIFSPDFRCQSIFSPGNSGVSGEFQSIFSCCGRPRRCGSRTMPRRWEMTLAQSSAP